MSNLYHAIFRGLAILSDLSEQSKVDIFVRNLKDEVKLCITSAIPNTLVEVISKVLEIDTNLLLCKRNTNNGFPGINYFGNQGSNKNNNFHNNSSNPKKDLSNADKWCEFHQNSSHNSVDCRTRKNKDENSSQIRTLIIRIIVILIFVGFVIISFVIKRIVINCKIS
jgi:hypothetical protein